MKFPPIFGDKADIRQVFERLGLRWRQVTLANANLPGHITTGDVRDCIAGTCCCPPVRKIEAPKPYPEKM